MSRFADPHRCPDCNATISPADPACPRCGLSLRGETAQQLYATLVRADELLEELRAASVPAGVPVGAATSSAGAAPDLGTAAVSRRRRGLRPTTVPQILLALGAGCLLVAALVFLVVTWSVLGVGGRTATLVVLTVVAGGCATVMARRGLRAAAESLALVGYGLLALDVLGADHAGWFGDLSTSGVEVVLGSVLVSGGLVGAVAARRTALAALTAGEVVAVIGSALVAVGVAGTDRLPLAPSLVLATLLPAAVAGLTRRLRLVTATTGTGAVTGLAWLSLATYALGRAFANNTWRELWTGGEVWPLLVSAALVAGLVLLPGRPPAVRVGGPAVAHLLLTCALLAPTALLDPTAVTLVAIGVLAAAGAAAVLLPRPWGLVNVVTQAVAGAAVLGVGGLLAGQAAARLLDAAHPVWSGTSGDRLPALSASAGSPDQPAGWLLPLCVLALLGTAWSLSRALTGSLTGAAPTLGRSTTVLGGARLVAALLAGSVVAAVALRPAPLWLVLGLLVVVAAGFTAWWLLDRPGEVPTDPGGAARPGTGSSLPLAPAALSVATAVVVALHADGLSAGVLSTAVVLCAVVLVHGRTQTVSWAAGLGLAATLAGCAWSWTAVAGAGPQWAALVGLAVLGALVLLTPYGGLSARIRTRAALEVGAAAAAAVLVPAGVWLAPVSEHASWAAVYLTLCGAVVSVLSLVRPDRRALAWAGGALLAAASWVRLWDIGVTAPEAYTLPTAVVLVLVGLRRMHRDRSAGTMRTLSPGLSLMLVPSLVWVLVDPTGPRALLLGLGCLVLVLAGARLGWTAPLLLGAAAGTLLVLRLAAPYVGDAVPRWVLLGAAGALLVAVGATWERRLSEAHSVLSRLRRMR